MFLLLFSQQDPSRSQPSEQQKQQDEDDGGAVEMPDDFEGVLEDVERKEQEENSDLSEGGC